MKNIILQLVKGTYFRLLAIMLIFCFSGTARAQLVSNMKITGSSQVGCERAIGNGPDFEIVMGDPCENVCESSVVDYTVRNSSSTLFVWEVVGGHLISNTNAATCSVQWDNTTGYGEVRAYEAKRVNGVVVKDGYSTFLCVQRVPSPSIKIEIPNITNMNHVFVCTGETVWLLGKATAGASEIKYWNWDFGDGTSSAQQTVSHVWNNPGEYVVRLTARTACGCSSTVEVPITVNHGTPVQIHHPSTVCENTPVQYTSPAQCDPSGWGAIGGTVQNPGQYPPLIIWDNVGDDSYGYVTLRNSFCGQSNCLAYSSIRIPVIKAIGTMTGKTDVCLHTEGIYSVPQTPSTRYTWTVDPNHAQADIIPFGTENKVIVRFHQSGQVHLRVNYENTMLGCTGTATMVINVAPEVKITGAGYLCEGQQATYTYTENGVAKLTNWMLRKPDGSVQTFSNVSQISNYTFTTPGVYIISAAYQNPCSPDSRRVEVSPKPPVPVITAADEYACLNTPMYYSIPRSQNNAYTYRWEVVNGTSLQYNQNEINVTWNTFDANTKLKAYYVSSIAGCSSNPAEMSIKSFSTYEPEITADSDARHYENCVRKFYVDYPNGSKYEWRLYPPTAGTIINSTGNMIEVQWNEISSNVSVRVEVDVFKCDPEIKISQKKYFTLYNTPMLDVIKSGDEVCANEEQEYRLSDCAGYDEVDWYVDGEFKYRGEIFRYTFENYTNEVEIHHIAGRIKDCPCKGITRQGYTEMKVLPSPIPAILALDPTVICLGDPNPVHVKLEAVDNGVINIIDYQWYYNGMPVASGPSFTAIHLGGYHVEALGENGCRGYSDPVNIIQRECRKCEDWTKFSIADCRDIIYVNHPAPGTPFMWESDNAHLLNNPADAMLEFEVLKPGAVEIRGIHGNQVFCIKAFIDFLPKFEFKYICDGLGFYYYFVNKTLAAPGYGKNFGVDWYLDGNYMGNGFITGHRFPYSDNNTTHEIEIVILDANGYSTAKCRQYFTIQKKSRADYTVSDMTCRATVVEFKPTAAAQAVDQVYSWNFGNYAPNGAYSTLMTPKALYEYNGSGYTHSLTTTDILGCTDTRSGYITVVNNKLDGHISMDPSIPVCEGDMIQLKYVPNAGTPTPVRYLWSHNGSTSPVAYTNLKQDHFVEVRDQYGCVKTIGPVIPDIVKPVDAIIWGSPIVCKGEGTLELHSVATDPALKYEWYRNTSLIGTTPVLTGDWAPGTYTVELRVKTHIGGGVWCTKTTQVSVRVIPVTATPVISYEVIKCNPYVIELQVNNAHNGYYCWNTNEFGNPIYSYTGGPYSVLYYSPEWCSAESNTVQVPLYPDAYFGNFPQGEYSTFCDDGNMKYIYMPFYFPSGQDWHFEWFRNQSVVSHGDISGTTILNLPVTPSLGLTEYEFGLVEKGINCYDRTDPYYVNWKKCGDCDLELHKFDIVCSKTEMGLNAYQISGYIVNNHPYNLYYTLTTDVGSLVYQGGILYPGWNYFTALLVPPAGYNGGPVNFNLVAGNNQNDDYCTYKFNLHMLDCGWKKSLSVALPETTLDEQYPSMENTNGNLLQLYPNPANTDVTIVYEFPKSEAKQYIEIYDVNGKRQGYWELPQNTGKLQFAVSNWAVGTYILKMISQGEVIATEKMVIAR